jgi:abortive infection bacteriophage resistance protein
MTLPVRVEFSYDKRGCYRRGDPFSIVFVYPYPEFDKPFIIKGGIRKIEDWLESKYVWPAILHETFWYHGSCRTRIHFNNIKNVYLFDKTNRHSSLQKILEHANISEPIKRFVLYDHQRIPPAGVKLITTFNRIPRKWIRELDPYVRGQIHSPQRRRLIQI